MNTNYFFLNLRVKNNVNYFFTLLAIALCLHTVKAQTPCDAPSALTLQSISTTSATITWTAPATAPWYGYDYWHTTIPAYTPTSSTSPVGSVSNTSVTLDSSLLIPGTTRYFFVRSRCGTVTGNTYGSWIGPLSFTSIIPGTSCPNAPYGQYPEATFTPAYTGSPEIINADAFAGEYSRVNYIQNRQYVFNTSNPSDFITITNSNLSTVIAYGPAPLTWNSTNNQGVLRYYISSNSSCAPQQVDRTRYITAQLVPSGCDAPTALYTSSISTTGATLYWTYANSTNGGYQYYYSTNSGTPGINATPNGTTTFDYKALTNLTSNTTYYYWIRNVCGTTYSNWVSGGSFTTQATNVTGCTGALYGQEPSTTFTPACSGSPEIISTSMWAGQYSNINILPNKTYTFTSSVATDFITVRDELTSLAYASGTTPLVWSSGANTTELKVFIHTNSSCGSQNVNRTFRITCQSAASCAGPSAYSISSITGTSAIINWVAASPAPSSGYQYYYNTTNATPTAGTTPSGSTTTTPLSLTGLTANTTYYFWVRSNCGSSQGAWVFGNNFTTVGASAGCTNGLLYPADTFTPTCFGNDEVIVTDAYTGEYANINISANTQYTFKSSVTSDYITITNANASVIYTAGNTPLVWLSGSNSGVIRYYFHSNNACATQNADRTKYIACQAATSCNSPSGLSVSAVTTSGATLNWTAANPVPSNGYQYYLSTSSTPPTAATVVTGNTAANSTGLTGLNPSTQYHFWVRSNCGLSQGTWIGPYNFMTPDVIVTGCTDSIWPQFPATTYVPSCTGATETIVTNAYCNEYSVISILPNKQYTFSSSTPTDFITISDSNGSVVRASGTTPIVWLSGANTGLIRYYFHTDSSCGDSAAERSKFITCTNALANENFDWSDFKVYPNPTEDMLNVSYSSAIDKVEIFNMLGQTVIEKAINAHETAIDMSRLTSGTYFVKAYTNDKSKVFKVIKE